MSTREALLVVRHTRWATSMHMALADPEAATPYKAAAYPMPKNQSKVIVSLATIAATSIDLLIVLQYAEAVAKQITIRTNARALMQSASAQSIPAI